MAKKKRSYIGCFVLLVLLSAVAIAGLTGYYVFAKPNVQGSKRIHIYIPTDSTYSNLLVQLQDKNAIQDIRSFEVVAQMKDLPYKIKSGHYVLSPGMNNRQIVNLFRAGLQEPVKLVIYNIRTKEEFAGLVGKTLELDSVFLLLQLNNDSFCKTLGLDTTTILTHFIVDNYELWWNTPFDKFMEKMAAANNRFWDEEKIAKANKLGLKNHEVITLATIVEKEAIFNKELPTIAGVYLNRLKIGMPLQADPTLVFALRDFTAKRVTNYHKDFESPYNTYLNTGLPPGPICMPRKISVDAVLNAEQHQYLYFCANPDMSGYSVFSKSYEDQMKVAARYRKKLDAMNIR